MYRLVQNLYCFSMENRDLLCNLVETYDIRREIDIEVISRIRTIFDPSFDVIGYQKYPPAHSGITKQFATDRNGFGAHIAEFSMDYD